jgi:hypothetical protein
VLFLFFSLPLVTGSERLEWPSKSDALSNQNFQDADTFSLPSREAVDALHAELTATGYVSRHGPHDAFWGSRFAIIQDPDGRDVGLMSLPDPTRRFVPGP